MRLRWWAISCATLLIDVALCQDACSKPDATTTISNAGQLSTLLSSCKIFDGSIAIAASDARDLRLVDLDNLEEITGDLVVANNTQLERLASQTLVKIGGDLRLNECPQMDELKMPKLTRVGRMLWSSLPNLQDYEFDAGIDSVSRVDISNTQLQALTGLNIKAADEIFITNNPYMLNISILLNNVGKSLVIKDNGPLNVEFPNLLWANNMTLSEIASISMPRLNYVNDSFRTSHSAFFAFDVPSLSVIKGTLALNDVWNVTTVNLPGLLSAGGLEIRNNTDLTVVSFGQLATVTGNVNISGHFSNISTYALQSVTGDFHLATSNSSFDCEDFDYLKSIESIKGVYQCEGRHPDPSLFDPTTPTDERLKPALSTGAKAGIGVGAAVAAAAIIGGGLLYLLRRKKRVAEMDGTGDKALEYQALGELDSKKQEPLELGHGKEAQELAAEHGVSEASPTQPVRSVAGTHELP
ncbi:hypothetical protein BDV95DRAFT_612523 [Massariosphaeria phaeospora]|uniref:Receptor L-domain domain-containing protein n=1 Tax=Massariosphaeria phaeospora TaxID=100035 RepID=A0A7C8I5H6_9PLEO|nr:hypothetical protein BDV95DRAFT_612523 [Massariosphaeria phaeospora]